MTQRPVLIALAGALLLLMSTGCDRHARMQVNCHLGQKNDGKPHFHCTFTNLGKQPAESCVLVHVDAPGGASFVSEPICSSVLEPDSDRDKVVDALDRCPGSIVSEGVQVDLSGPMAGCVNLQPVQGEQRKDPPLCTDDTRTGSCSLQIFDDATGSKINEVCVEDANARHQGVSADEGAAEGAAEDAKPAYTFKCKLWVEELPR